MIFSETNPHKIIQFTKIELNIGLFSKLRHNKVLSCVVFAKLWLYIYNIYKIYYIIALSQILSTLQIILPLVRHKPTK